jgi:hypothetical protein
MNFLAVREGGAAQGHPIECLMAFYCTAESAHAGIPDTHRFWTCQRLQFAAIENPLKHTVLQFSRE